MVETRAAQRHRVMKPAQIEFGGYKRVLFETYPLLAQHWK
jgi:hypothetical protein